MRGCVVAFCKKRRKNFPEEGLGRADPIFGKISLSVAGMRGCGDAMSLFEKSDAKTSLKRGLGGLTRYMQKYDCLLREHNMLPYGRQVD